MKNINLYVTDWAPNGTNDLLVCDENHQIIAAVEAATFGIDVTRCAPDLETVLVANDREVFPIPRDEAGEALSMPSDLVLVRQINTKTLRNKLAVSPVDPDGTDVLTRLKAAGVDLN